MRSKEGPKTFRRHREESRGASAEARVELAAAGRRWMVFRQFPRRGYTRAGSFGLYDKCPGSFAFRKVSDRMEQTIANRAAVRLW